MLFPSLRVFLLLPALAVLVRALPTTVGELAPELDLGETTELELDFGEHHSGLEGRAPKATVYTQCTATAASGKRVAFTFDDGPYLWMRDVVNEFKKYNGKTTFFVNGQNWGQCIYNTASVDRLKYAYSQGMQIGSHTWAHKDLITLSRTQIETEFKKTQDAIRKVLGVSVAHTRAPYGNTNTAVLEVAAAQKQQIIRWNVDVGDTTGSASVTTRVNNYKNRIKNGAKPNILDVQHETNTDTVHKVLPEVLKAYNAAGFKFVTVAECLGLQPYLSTGAAGVRDSTWKC